MPEVVNTGSLGINAFSEDHDRKTMIQVDHVSMVFNMASEQLNNLKEYFIALARKELRFKEFRALDDISLEVKEGDVFGILGTNGSGKSTLLKIIAGVLEPTEGSCTINGNIAPLIELGAGFDMDLTARENIYLNGSLLGYPKRFIEEHFDEIVDFAEIEQFLDMPLKNYSSGMVARIAFAIATVIVPEILIVDEVLSVGDFMFQKKCEDRIMSLINEHNVTVLIVSHNNDQIERLCNKAAWIEKGHLRMMGSAKEVCDTYRVLGGHTGSKESEAKVFEALTCDIVPLASSYTTIAADSRYGMAAKFTGLCFSGNVPKVILASGDHNMDSLISTGLAGALNAPLLLIQNDHIPDATIQELKRLNPEEVILVNSGDMPKHTVLDLMEQHIGQTYPITCLEGSNYPELSRTIISYGKARKLWGESVIATYVECVTDLISLSPYTYAKKCPILLQDPTLDHLDEENRQIAEKEGFTTLLVLGDSRGFPEETLQSLEQQGLSVTRFCGKDVFDANTLINDWLISEGFFNKSMQEVLVAAAWNAPDAFGAAGYAALNRCPILLEDPQDLDSISHTIDYITGKNGQIKSVTFIGDRMRFNKMDKLLLAKTVTKALLDSGINPESEPIDQSTQNQTDRTGD